MADCILCGKKANLLAKKCHDGHICSDCGRFLSPNIAYSSATKEYLEKIKKENEELPKEFDYTNNYGWLYIDVVHGMFLISRKADKDGEPMEFGEIFRVEDLTGVGLYISEIKNIGTNGKDRIVCDIAFKMQTEDRSLEYKIARQKKCDFKYEGTKINWQEPGDFQVFRNTFDEMLKGTWIFWKDKFDQMQEMRGDVSKGATNESWAKGVLFIDNKKEATEELVKSRRNLLVKIFHPDNAKTGNAEIMRQITEAYDRLS